jgi:hypothetical protein
MVLSPGPGIPDLPTAWAALRVRAPGAAQRPVEMSTVRPHRVKAITVVEVHLVRLVAGVSAAAVAATLAVAA